MAILGEKALLCMSSNFDAMTGAKSLVLNHLLRQKI